MLKEFRFIWATDQYKSLGPNSQGTGFYFGRIKGNTYQVILRYASKKTRKIIQTVYLNKNWYWNFKQERLVQKKYQSIKKFSTKEDVVIGYSWNSKNKKTKTLHLEDLSSKVQIKKIKLSTGAQVIWLIPKDPKKYLITFHGGPESYESNEIRYGGLYRDLLRNNIAIGILNYAGSNKLKINRKKQVWGKWESSIQKDFMELLFYAKSLSINKNKIEIFGASFGAALALVIHKKFKIKKTIIASPLLDLQNQMQRGGCEYQKWFKSRFSNIDLKSFSFKNLTQIKKGNIYCILSEFDQVLSPETNRQLRKEKAFSENWFLINQKCPHAPKFYMDMKFRYENVLNWILK